jgi:putative PIN family toxin of toxin-antitoxin system
MIKVVVDTNIIISSLLVPNGSCYQVMNLIYNYEFALFYSDDILSEYRAVLSRSKFHFHPDVQNETIRLVKERGICFNPAKSTIPLQDESDRMFYDLADSTKSFIITGNQKHFPSGTILTPREFLERFGFRLEATAETSGEVGE